jgi:hypothetical protein
VFPELVRVALHDWVTLWPPAYCQVTVQPEIARPPAVTVTAAWKPPCHCPVTAYAAVQQAKRVHGVSPRLRGW